MDKALCMRQLKIKEVFLNTSSSLLLKNIELYQFLLFLVLKISIKFQHFFYSQTKNKIKRRENSFIR